MKQSGPIYAKKHAPRGSKKEQPAILCYSLLACIYVTSFSSISYYSNSEIDLKNAI